VLFPSPNTADSCGAPLSASTVGTTIEWYDFLLYSVVTGLVFGKLFFPESDPLVGVLQAFAVYTVGFIARRIGAPIFGHYGDRIGRKAALITTLLPTGLATLACRPPGSARFSLQSQEQWHRGTRPVAGVHPGPRWRVREGGASVGLYPVVFPPCTLCGLR